MTYSALGCTFYQGCGAGVGVVRSRRFLRGVGVLTTLGVGVGFICPTPTPDVQSNHFLHHTIKFLLKWYNFF